jgi:hypothetical protein
MTALLFSVGMNVDGSRQSVTVEAEDALIAALKVKHERPNAVINYVRKANQRGDRRHPHQSITRAGE